MSSKPKTMFTLNLRLKLLFPLLALVTVIFILFYIGIQRYIENTIFGILEEETAAIIDYVTICMDEDELQSLIESDVEYDDAEIWVDGMEDQRYWKQQKCLEEVDGFNPRAEIYTYHMDEKDLAYGIDQWATLMPEESYPFRDIVPSDDEDYDKMITGLQETYHYDGLKYDEDYDVYYYATITPVKNSRGEIISGMVIYIDSNWVTNSLQNLSQTLLAGLGLIYGLFALLILFITRRVTRQLSDLSEAAKRVADGDYTPVSIGRQTFRDEVFTLEELFNSMLDKIRGREQSLKQEVEELKIQIDMEKRQREVKEIVESEFFQDLKAKAATVRRKRQDQS